MYELIILILIICLFFLCWKKYYRTEHEHPGFGTAGQYGLRDFKVSENFYSSGSRLRYKPEADTSTEITIPNQLFNEKELSFIMNR